MDVKKERRGEKENRIDKWAKKKEKEKEKEIKRKKTILKGQRHESSGSQKPKRSSRMTK